MSTLIIDNHIKNQFDKLPSGWAHFALRGAQGILYSGATANLARKLNFLQNKAEEGGLYAEMWAKVVSLTWTSYPRGLEALIRHKVLLVEHAPDYQYRLQPWANYAYLAIDPLRYPFVTVTEHTNDDWLYLGPFRSRFFVADIIDIYSRILKLPYCETGIYPCDKFERDVCRGWCLSLATAEESKNEHSLEKLDALLKEAFLHPENGILEMVQQQREIYYNDLEFIKAALLDDEIALLAQYRDWLNYLYVAKKMDYEDENLIVHKGKIVMCRIEGKEYHFPPAQTEFRANEALALNLDNVDESRIIYDFLVSLGKPGSEQRFAALSCNKEK